MKNTRLIGITLLALALLATACSPAATPVPTVVPSTDTPAAVSSAAASSMAASSKAAIPSGPATVAVSTSNATLGSFLVDDKGMTLYMFTKDTPNTSTCYDKCAAAWPPLLTTGKPVAGTGADASLLGTTMRTDGTTQVTYNGWPLYYYTKDTAIGDTNGQNTGSVWFVVSPAGMQINK